MFANASDPEQRRQDKAEVNELNLYRMIAAEGRRRMMRRRRGRKRMRRCTE
jgi:hypothetical protein